MFFRSIGKFISEAFKSVFKNGFMTFASVIIVTICLILFGVLEVVTVNVNSIGEQISGNCQLQVYLKKDITDLELTNVAEKIDSYDFVREKSYLTGKDRFDKFKEDKDPETLAYLSNVPDSAIKSSYQVTLKDTDEIDKAVTLLSRIDGVEKVVNDEEVISFINTLKNVVNNFSLWMVIVFAFISIFIISNTIKLTLYSRRKEINIMKYIGAKDYYIRGPFVTEGIFVGLIAACIAFGLTYVLYTWAINSLNATFTFLNQIKFKKFSELLIVLIPSYAVMGIGLGAVGSAVSIRKYLKV